MLWLIVFCVIGFIGMVAIFGAIASQSTEVRTTAGAVIFLAILANVVWTGFMSVHFVDARNVAVVRSFGKITGQIDEGFKVTAPWQTIEEYNIRLQFITPKTNCANGSPKCMNAGSVDIQDIYVQTTVNLEVAPRDVQNLARNIGQNYIDNIVNARIEQVTKAIISTYRADTILARREEIRQRITEQLRNELAPYSIDVKDVLINDIDFTDGFRAQIDAKSRAEQEALTADNVVRVREAEARQAAAVAQGQADRLRIEAQGQADANRLVASSVTDNLVRWQAIQKLNDKVQVIIMEPSGLVNLGNFLPTPATR